jgi:Reverse transcriptase (RNA-dependent DNA polymerase)
MVPDKDLQISQMDVKDAYLNSKLQEDVYMCQLEGYSNGTDKVCHLLKTLYGLYQSGCEWNNEFNKGILDLKDYFLIHALTFADQKMTLRLLPYRLMIY